MLTDQKIGLSQSDIDKDSPIPYHYQLRELLRTQIVTGVWEVGARLPSENDLCKAVGLSRPTVRQALDALVEEGLLLREKGRGTFVTEPKLMERWAGTPIGFSDSMGKQGYKIETTVLGLDVQPAPKIVMHELRLQSDEPVVVLQRLRYVLNEPILLVTSYLPERLFPSLVNIDFQNHSLYQILREEYGINIVRIRRSIEAIAANTEEAKMLQIVPGAPLLMIENTTFVEDGTPIEYFEARRRGDRSRFEIDYRYQPQDDAVDA